MAHTSLISDTWVNEIDELVAGDHACCLVNADLPQCELLTRFLQTGLRRSEHVLYLAEPASLARLRRSLHVWEPLATTDISVNQLTLLEAPVLAQECLSLMEAACLQAHRQGTQGLRIIVDVPLSAVVDSEQLSAYERNIDTLLEIGNVLVVCQYDRRQLSSAIFSQILAHHCYVFMCVGENDATS